jgi:hypothetical protein
VRRKHGGCLLLAPGSKPYLEKRIATIKAQRQPLQANRKLGNLDERAESIFNHTAGPSDPRDNLLSLQSRFEF